MQSGQCCRCNGNGTCVRCDCTKAARKCWSCLPSKKDRCKNSAIPSPPQPEQAVNGHRQPTVQDNATGTVLTVQCDDASVDASAAKALTATLLAECRDPVPVDLPCRGEVAADHEANQSTRFTGDQTASAASDSQQFAWRALDQLQPTTVVTEGGADEPPAGAQSDSQQYAWRTLDQHQARTSASQESPVPTPEEVDLVANLDQSQLQQTPTHSDQELEEGPRDLPNFPTAPTTGFLLGERTNLDSVQAVQDVYEEVVHCRPNAMQVPRGATGKLFVSQLSNYIVCFGTSGPYEGIALKVAMVFQMLMLQKPPGPAEKSADFLQRRLAAWHRGDLHDLLHECRTIQEELTAPSRPHRGGNKEKDDARHFANLVTSGKLSNALRSLAPNGNAGALALDDSIGDKSVQEVLQDKHPDPAPLATEALIQGVPPPQPHPVRFSGLNRDLVRKAVLNTHGAAGPSGVDAEAWRWMCTMFSDASDSLCDALASSARRVATEFVDPRSLEAYLADSSPSTRTRGLDPLGLAR